jgi:hypothetical protein
MYAPAVIASMAVKNIIDDLNNRSGFDLRSLDKQTQKEIEETWEAIVENAVVAVSKIK